MKRYRISAEKMETIKKIETQELKSTITEMKISLHGFQHIEESKRKIQ